MAKLSFVIDDEPEVVVPFDGLLTLGRDEDNDVVLDDDRISRHHAVLVCYGDGRVEIRDMGSTAGTLINDQSIQSHFYSPGERLAFGPLIAQITLDPSPDLAALKTEEKTLTDLQESISDLTRQLQEKETALLNIETSRATTQLEAQNLVDQQSQEKSRLQELRQSCEKAEQNLQELRQQLTQQETLNLSSKQDAEKTEERILSATQRLDQLTHEQQNAQETLQRLLTEVTAAEQQQTTLHATVQQIQAHLATRELALQNAQSDESTTRTQLSLLATREEELRKTLEDLGPNIEKARDELQGLQTRLLPLRDWKASMDQRYERLGSLTKDSAEEIELWREIEEAQAALFDLLPASRISTPRLSRGDFPRISSRSGVPLKSERIRRSG